MGRKVIDTATSFLGYINKDRRYSPDVKGAVKVNLGAGLAVAPGWINIDESLNAFFAGWPGFVHKVLYRLSGANRYYSLAEYCALLKTGEFLHHDLSYGIPLRDSSVDYVYSSHFIEHLFREDAVLLLKDAYRVLRATGVIRVAVPDLAFAMEMYRTGNKEKMLADYFFVDDLGSYLARHKYMYDFELLEKLLRETGFTKIKRRSYREGAVPDIDALDNRPEDSLYVEAEK